MNFYWVIFLILLNTGLTVGYGNLSYHYEWLRLILLGAQGCLVGALIGSLK